MSLKERAFSFDEIDTAIANAGIIVSTPVLLGIPKLHRTIDMTEAWDDKAWRLLSNNIIAKLSARTDASKVEPDILKTHFMV